MTLRKKIVTGTAAGLLLIAAALVYEVAIPNIVAKNYNQQLRTNAHQLQTTLETTNTLTSITKVFTKDAVVDATGSKKELTTLKASLEKSKASTVDFKKSANGLRHLPLSGYFGAYRQAKTTKSNAVTVADKVTDKVSTYKTLIDFLVSVNQIAIDSQPKMVDFSKLDNPTINQTISALRKNAQGQRETQIAYQKLTPPADIRNDSLQITALTGGLADGLEAYAAALERGDQTAADNAFNSNNEMSKKSADLNEKMRQTITSKDSPMKAVESLPKLVSDLKL